MPFRITPIVSGAGGCQLLSREYESLATCVGVVTEMKHWRFGDRECDVGGLAPHNHAISLPAVAERSQRASLAGGRLVVDVAVDVHVHIDADRVGLFLDEMAQQPRTSCQ